MIAIGIDPGLSGAIASVDMRGTCSISDIPTVADPGGGMVKRRVQGRELARLLRSMVPPGLEAFTLIERVRVMGGKDNATQTQGSLLQTQGSILAVLDIVCPVFEFVEPKAWQKFYGLVGKKREKRARGELPQAVKLALKLYPSSREWIHQVQHHNRAEALLIAHYALQQL